MRCFCERHGHICRYGQGDGFRISQTKHSRTGIINRVLVGFAWHREFANRENRFERELFIRLITQHGLVDRQGGRCRLYLNDRVRILGRVFAAVFHVRQDGRLVGIEAHFFGRGRVAGIVRVGVACARVSVFVIIRCCLIRSLQVIGKDIFDARFQDIAWLELDLHRAGGILRTACRVCNGLNVACTAVLGRTDRAVTVYSIALPYHGFLTARHTGYLQVQLFRVKLRILADVIRDLRAGREIVRNDLPERRNGIRYAVYHKFLPVALLRHIAEDIVLARSIVANRNTVNIYTLLSRRQYVRRSLDEVIHRRFGVFTGIRGTPVEKNRSKRIIFIHQLLFGSRNAARCTGDCCVRFAVTKENNHLSVAVCCERIRIHEVCRADNAHSIAGSPTVRVQHIGIGCNAAAVTQGAPLQLCSGFFGRQSLIVCGAIVSYLSAEGDDCRLIIRIHAKNLSQKAALLWSSVSRTIQNH